MKYAVTLCAAVNGVLPLILAAAVASCGAPAAAQQQQPEVKGRCRTELQARAPEITGNDRVRSPGIDHVDFTLASVWYSAK